MDFEDFSIIGVVVKIFSLGSVFEYFILNQINWLIFVKYIEKFLNFSVFFFCINFY